MVILLTAYVVATVAVFKEADNSNILGDTKAEAATLFGGVATAEPAGAVAATVAVAESVLVSGVTFTTTVSVAMATATLAVVTIDITDVVVTIATAASAIIDS